MIFAYPAIAWRFETVPVPAFTSCPRARTTRATAPPLYSLPKTLRTSGAKSTSIRQMGNASVTSHLVDVLKTWSSSCVRCEWCIPATIGLNRIDMEPRRPLSNADRRRATPNTPRVTVGARKPRNTISVWLLP